MLTLDMGCEVGRGPRAPGMGLRENSRVGGQQGALGAWDRERLRPRGRGMGAPGRSWAQVALKPGAGVAGGGEASLTLGLGEGTAEEAAGGGGEVVPERGPSGREEPWVTGQRLPVRPGHSLGLSQELCKEPGGRGRESGVPRG